MRQIKSIKTKIVFVIGFLTIFSAISINAQALETQEIDLKGCIQTNFGQEFVIKDRAAFLKAIRNDAGREACLKNSEEIDFDKNSLLGIELNTGYCRTPVGLTARAVKNEAEKRYVLTVEYLEPDGLCRALSRYDLWVLVPKLPENYRVEFAVKATPRLNSNR